MKDYFKAMLARKWYVSLWGVLVICINLIGLLFLEDWRGQAAVVCLFLAELSRFLLFKKFGDSKLLALAHIYWIPMLFFFSRNTFLVEMPPDKATWLSFLIVFNSLSLIIDGKHLWDYFKSQPSSLRS